jgi:hypothetical protein
MSMKSLELEALYPNSVTIVNSGRRFNRPFNFSQTGRGAPVFPDLCYNRPVILESAELM